MVSLSKKVLAVLIIVSCVIAILAFAAAINFGGLGTALAGAGGPIAAGFYSLLNAPLAWASSGGWPTLAVFYFGFLAVVFGFAYVIWHFDVPYKIQGATVSTGTLAHTVTQEPEEPERAPQPQPVAQE